MTPPPTTTFPRTHPRSQPMWPLGSRTSATEFVADTYPSVIDTEHRGRCTSHSALIQPFRVDRWVVVVALHAGVMGDTVPVLAADRPRQAVQRTNLIVRSEEHTSELQSLMRISYDVFCLKKKK